MFSWKSNKACLDAVWCICVYVISDVFREIHKTSWNHVSHVEILPCLHVHSFIIPSSISMCDWTLIRLARTVARLFGSSSSSLLTATVSHCWPSEVNILGRLVCWRQYLSPCTDDKMWWSQINNAKVIRCLIKWKLKTSLWHPKPRLEIAGPGCHKSSSWYPGQWGNPSNHLFSVFQETVLQPPRSMLKPCWLNLWTAQLCSLCADPGCKCITTCIPPLRRKETGASLE